MRTRARGRAYIPYLIYKEEMRVRELGVRGLYKKKDQMKQYK